MKFYYRAQTIVRGNIHQEVGVIHALNKREAINKVPSTVKNKLCVEHGYITAEVAIKDFKVKKNRNEL